MDRYYWLIKDFLIFVITSVPIMLGIVAAIGFIVIVDVLNNFLD